VRKLLALVFSGPLLAISILTLSLITSSFVFTPANAAPNSIEINSISQVSCTSVEILFESSVPKKSLANYVITAAVDPSVGQPKNIKKIIKTKATGLITAEIKNLNPKVAYKFSVSAKTNKGKMINSEAVEHISLCDLMDKLSNLPADWGNPKPTQLPTAAPVAAPTATTTVISAAAIAGVTAPITGGTPVTTTTADTGYTGTISWSGTPTTFASVTTYTATITITPTSGYTLTGVTANFFSVAGATSVTHSANAGVITAVFSATAPGAAAKVAITRASVGTSPGVAFTTQPQITIQDSAGNTVTSSAAVVTATVSAGGTLVGTLTATASSGVATFSTLGIRGFGGTAYTITYTTSGLTAATQSVTPSALIVGNTGPGGGKIYYVAGSAGFTCGPTLNETCYYLEAAPGTLCNWPGTNEPWGIFWSCEYYFWSDNGVDLIGPSARNNGIGSGYANTLAMLGQTNGGTEGYAGTVARAYGGPNTLLDWYLPSYDELLTFVWYSGVYDRSIYVDGPGFWVSSEMIQFNMGTGGAFEPLYASAINPSNDLLVESQGLKNLDSGYLDFGALVWPVRSF
jgi:hypothetical protein